MKKLTLLIFLSILLFTSCGNNDSDVSNKNTDGISQSTPVNKEK